MCAETDTTSCAHAVRAFQVPTHEHLKVAKSAIESCVIVGEGALIVPCARLLVSKGVRVEAVFSSEPAVVAWAASSHVPVFGFDQLGAEAPAADALLSIVNLRMIGEQVLSRYEVAINFHDGPLPRYAGLNTTSWAIINGEAEHAVTWHQMLGGPDRGDIYVQQVVAISTDDTSFSLNASCFDAGISSFRTLCDALVSGQLAGQPQDPSKRTYFSRAKRPAGACGLDFGRPSEVLIRLARGLDFASWRNPLGMPRVTVGGRVYAVTSVATASGSGSPGTILSVLAERATVATSDGAVVLSGWRSTGGQPLDASLMEILSVGDSLSADAFPELGERYEAAAKHEEAHAECWRALQFPRLALLSDGIRAAAPEARLARRVELGVGGWDAAVSFAAFIARLSPGATYDIGLRLRALHEGIVALPTMFSSLVFARVALSLSNETSKELTQVCEAFAAAEAFGVWALDAPARLQVLPPSPLVEVCDDNRLQPQAPLALLLDGDDVSVSVDGSRVSETELEEWCLRFERFAAALSSADTLDSISLITETESARLASWNDTETPVPEFTVDALIRQRCDHRPTAPALICGADELTREQLDHRVNRLAHHLRSIGVVPGELVGLYLPRGIDLVVCALAVWRAGGAYVPLDPAYPSERVAHMASHAQLRTVLTHSQVCSGFPGDAMLVRVDALEPSLRRLPESPPQTLHGAADAAYVIYTSGSTGTPKGVVVEHRNVANFVLAMDAAVGTDPDPTSASPGVWLAVTSLSFDISVLELFYTLARGFSVVVHVEPSHAARPDGLLHEDRGIEMGLFYFSSDASEHERDKYRLLIEGAKFGDANGFNAVWTPERHFHAFGGLYPNPAVTGAAVAAITEHVSIRAGSCVTPLHHPVRVAEDWSIVDNLSNGRVGVSIAAGWQPNDFVLRPENHADRKNVMLRDLETLRALWRGEEQTFDGPDGPISVRTLPRPVQAELPVWVTAAGNPETFREAGRIGANVLTHLLGQTPSEVADKVAIYRAARADAGHQGRGIISLMLHTLVGEDDDSIKEAARGPMKSYLRSAMNLVKAAAWSFPTFKKTTTMEDGTFGVDHLSEDDLDALLDYAFERYYENSGLFGSVDRATRVVDSMKGLDVDEIACLIDFGVPTDVAIRQLPALAKVLQNVRAVTASEHAETLPEVVKRHGVTHMQCVPSMARMLAAMPDSREALGSLQLLLVGGEALPRPLANDLAGLVGGDVCNMYGPTETTVWSTFWRVSAGDGAVPIGTPVANTQIIIADAIGAPAAPGELGEVCIAGAGVTRGYLGRDDLTAERYIQRPENPETRLYRTGDLGRFRSDGMLEYHGRLDQQVKLRGYRIELGEVESCLARHPSVAHAAVSLREDTPGDQRLIAYVVPTSAGAPTLAELRAHAADALPSYMVPSAFVSLPSLPKTANGKLDRAKLPPPTAAPTSVSTAYIAPADDTQSQIVEVWKRSLGVERVGIDDNFFDLGGHSLLTVQVHAELQPLLAKPVTLVDLFRFPTVRTLSAFVSGESGGDAVEKGTARAASRKEAMAKRRGARHR
ncbi:MAG: natural product biosynthesis luciferase-like monooxygenase protein [Bradymonadia bacterium]|jgi:natural product biosynthesis luciferase-like monooxygenase protein